MPDNEACWSWTDKLMWSVVAMSVLGSIARTLISREPFESKRFFGDIILAAIGSIMMYSMGLMQGMTQAQIVFFGAGASLGGIRTIEWIMKIARATREPGGRDD